ncbi:glycosyl transferase [Corynebacterium stationis]|uniref:glycosyltransferase family 9 protein n=1 Tax=Corynebacterium stationis TaxID=1705 RepID=UPI0009508D28|nr:glycosyltransferase family 9 protein [Corynebacterium stationis]APT95696.1 glycosyl transferase [Corynebacterium stationis]
MRKVLVARLDSAGDVLVTGPAIRAVAASPEVTQLTLLCGPQGRSAAELLPGPTDLFTWASPWTVVPAPSADDFHIEILKQFVKREGFDEAIIFTSFHQSPLPLALILRMSGVKRITGASVDFAGSLLDVRLRPGEDFPEDQPETERAIGIAAAAGYRLPPDDDGRLRVSGLDTTLNSALPDKYIVVHPGAAVPARMWPPDRSTAAVELLIRRGHQVIVTGGKGETELTAQVAGIHGIDMGGKTDLRQTAEVLARADVVVSGNTGPAHLAAAVGTPVVSLFSPVVPPIRWAPYGVPVELLGDQEAACKNTRARDCPVAGHPCLASVTPTQVADAVERLQASHLNMRKR